MTSQRMAGSRGEREERPEVDRFPGEEAGGFSFGTREVIAGEEATTAVRETRILPSLGQQITSSTRDIPSF